MEASNSPGSEPNSSSSGEKTVEAQMHEDLKRSLEKLIKELHIASRIFSLYPPGHRALEEALETPYRRFQKIFWVKSSIHLEAWGSDLIVEGFYLRGSDFARDLLTDLDLLGIKSLVFKEGLTKRDLCEFLIFLTAKEREASADLEMIWQEKAITSIEVNTESLRQPSDTATALSLLSTRVSNLLQEKPQQLVELFAREGKMDDDAAAKIFGSNVRGEVVSKLVCEHVRTLSDQQSAQTLKEVLPGIDLTGLPPARRTAILKNIIDTFTFGRDQVNVIRELLDDFLVAGWSKGEILEILKPEAVRHWRLLDKAEEIMEALKKVEQKPPSKEEFRSVVQGCASSGNWQKLSQILGELSQILERGTEEQRHRVLEYLTGMMGAVSSNTPERFLRSLVEHSQNFYLRAPTRESESLLLELARELILLDYLAMAREVLSILRDQREAGDLGGPTSEREPLTDTIDPAVVDKLLSEICKGKSESAEQAVDLILTMGNKEAFKGLTEIFTSADKSVRLTCLRALRRGGDKAFWACDLLLRDQELLQVDCPDGYLEKEKWYKVRNAIFVLAELANPEGISTLLRVSECSDPRVRYEVTTAAEKIGGEQAVKLLVVLADDKDLKVRNRAIVAVGQIGRAEDASALITISRKHPDSLPTIVKVLGRLAGETSRDFLFALLENDEHLKERGLSKKEVLELRILALKALAQIKDATSLSKLQEYRDRKETLSRLLKKKDNLRATAISLLDEIEKKKPKAVQETVTDQ